MLSLLSSHNDFFERIILLIPSELYAVRDESDNEENSQDDFSEEEDNVNTKYFKHRKQPLSVDDRKLQSKQNKQAKYQSLQLGTQVVHNKALNDEIEGRDASTKNALDSLRERLQVKFDTPFLITNLIMY